MTTIEQIRNFVKSQLENNKRLSKENSIFAACGSEDETILRFLDTIESEKPMNPEGLEEEIDKYREEHLFDVPAFQQVARHFAQFGAEHLKK